MLEDLAKFLHTVLIRIEFAGETLTEIIRTDDSKFAALIKKFLSEGHDLPSAWGHASALFSAEQDKSFVKGILAGFGTAGIDEEREKAQNNLMLCREMLSSAKETMRRKGKGEAVIPLYISVVLALVLL